MTDEPKTPPTEAGHRRRLRYPGKNPRRFEERYKERAPEKYPEMEAHIRAQGRTPAGAHVPVLLKEVIECLAPRPGQVAVDCTLGYGGHARALLEGVGPTGRLIGIDTDGAEITRTTARLAGAGTLKTFHTNFAGLGRIVAAEAPEGVDIILADLGVSSMQLDDPARGFSYKQNGPLDMRMDHRIGKTAAQLLAELPEDVLTEALAGLSDEPDAAGIARAIIIHRARQPIANTQDLARVVFEAKGVPWPWRPRGETARALHPAALTFQALRMLVNDEAGKLAQMLRDAPYCLKPGGRIGVISFHSGEDRLVKHSFRDGFRSGLYAEWTQELVRPSFEERRDNPRSAPARFRWARRADEAAAE